MNCVVKFSTTDIEELIRDFVKNRMKISGNVEIMWDEDHNCTLTSEVPTKYKSFFDVGDEED